MDYVTGKRVRVCEYLLRMSPRVRVGLSGSAEKKIAGALLTQACCITLDRLELPMSIQSERELELLRIVGKIVRLALNAMAAAAAPGVTTAELDAICARVLAEHGAASAPKLVYNFPEPRVSA